MEACVLAEGNLAAGKPYVAVGFRHAWRSCGRSVSLPLSGGGSGGSGWCAETGLGLNGTIVSCCVLCRVRK